MSFNYFVHKYKLKNQATLNIKIQQVHSSSELDNVDIYLRNGPFSSNVGIVNLHESRGSHWVAFVNEIFLLFMVVLLLKNYLSLL